jgi:hypothetical protein
VASGSGESLQIGKANAKVDQKKYRNDAEVEQRAQKVMSDSDQSHLPFCGTDNLLHG